MVHAGQDIDSRLAQSGTNTQVWDWISTPLSTVAFWTAVTLPVIYLPLFLTGIDSTEGLLLFLGLFSLHILALIGGRHHNTPKR